MTPSIRHFTDADAERVDTVYTACHPAWPSKPTGYWWAHPTLVLEYDGEVVGSTSFSVGLAPHADLAKLVANQAEVGWGHGVYVHPVWRGHGWGWHLAEARHRALTLLGIRFFFGMTQPENRAMIAIFDRQHLTRAPGTFLKAYPDGQAGVLYHGEIV